MSVHVGVTRCDCETHLSMQQFTDDVNISGHVLLQSSWKAEMQAPLADMAVVMLASADFQHALEILSTGRGRNRCSESQRLWGPQYDGTTLWKSSAPPSDNSAAGDMAEGHHLGSVPNFTESTSISGDNAWAVITGLGCVRQMPSVPHLAASFEFV